MQKCPTCQARITPGAVFCEQCGETISQVQVARKLRQTSFTSIKDAKDGMLSPSERLKGKHAYVIEEAIARSGFGATFRAMRSVDEKQVLIKQMIDQPSHDQVRGQLMQSFKREAKFLRKIKHPAFPRGYEYFERNKSFYLVMDFINGKELAKALEDYRKKHGKVEDGLLVYLGIEIADALEVIHSHGYIYRDLKPQNVMLDGITSKVKLIDFGTLYHSSDKTPLLFESEGYTPPDLLDKSKPFTPAGDIYSLGALLYEAALGETPKLGDLKALSSSGRDSRLIAIIQKCLQVNPTERYQRSRQVRDELQKLTRAGFWPFRNKNRIAPVEISVLPKTLFPPACTFCEYCGFADSNSHAGYCKSCRVPLRVGRLALKEEKLEREFFLYADETIVGSAAQCHFPLPAVKGEQTINAQHIRIFRRKTSLYLEAIDRNRDNTLINRRKVVGPVELLDGDTIEIGSAQLTFTLKDAC